MIAAALCLAVLQLGGDPLDEARELIRAGLMAEADALLAEVRSDEDGIQSAAVRLLRGNVAFERRRFALAAALYEEAVDGFAGASPGAGDAGLEAARSNLERCRSEQARAMRLAAWGGRLRWALGLTLAAGAGLLRWLALRAR